MQERLLLSGSQPECDIVSSPLSKPTGRKASYPVLSLDTTTHLRSSKRRGDNRLEKGREGCLHESLRHTSLGIMEYSDISLEEYFGCRDLYE